MLGQKAQCLAEARRRYVAKAHDVQRIVYACAPL
jgi:hypothetical protein